MLWDQPSGNDPWRQEWKGGWKPIQAWPVEGTTLPLPFPEHSSHPASLPREDFPSSCIQGLSLTLGQSSCPLWVRGIRCELTHRAPLRCSDQQSKLNTTQIKPCCCQPLGWAKLPVLSQNEPLLHTPVTTGKSCCFSTLHSQPGAGNPPQVHLTAPAPSQLPFCSQLPRHTLLSCLLNGKLQNNPE